MNETAESSAMQQSGRKVQQQTALPEVVDSSSADLGSKLRSELRNLLSSPDFQKVRDIDQMTDILMGKLAEIAEQEESCATGFSHDIGENLKTFNSYEGPEEIPI